MVRHFIRSVVSDASVTRLEQSVIELIEAENLPPEVENLVFQFLENNFAINAVIRGEYVPKWEDFSHQHLSLLQSQGKRVDEQSLKSEIDKVARIVETKREVVERQLALSRERGELVKKHQEIFTEVRSRIKTIKQVLQSVSINPPQSLKEKYQKLEEFFDTQVFPVFQNIQSELAERVITSINDQILMEASQILPILRARDPNSLPILFFNGEEQNKILQGDRELNMLEIIVVLAHMDGFRTEIVNIARTHGVEYVTGKRVDKGQAKKVDSVSSTDFTESAGTNTTKQEGTEGERPTTNPAVEVAENTAKDKSAQSSGQPNTTKQIIESISEQLPIIENFKTLFTQYVLKKRDLERQTIVAIEKGEMGADIRDTVISIYGQGSRGVRPMIGSDSLYTALENITIKLAEVEAQLSQVRQSVMDISMQYKSALTTLLHWQRDLDSFNNTGQSITQASINVRDQNVGKEEGEIENKDLLSRAVNISHILRIPLMDILDPVFLRGESEVENPEQNPQMRIVTHIEENERILGLAMKEWNDMESSRPLLLPTEGE